MTDTQKKETLATRLATARAEIDQKSEQLKGANGRERERLRIAISLQQSKIRALEGRLKKLAEV